jgi:hypothetical protein
MSSLDETFKELLDRLRNPGTLNPATSDPIFYFVYPPEEMLELKRCLPRWISALGKAGYKILRISLGDMLWNAIEESGRWDDWLAAESAADPAELNAAVQDVLSQPSGLADRVAELVEAASPDTVVLMTEAEMLHPYFRTRTIESRLHDRVRAPTVIFYPGRRSGQYGLHFLDIHPVDGNYRSTLLGGV